MSKLGVHIYLHAFEYNRERPYELEKYCEKIFYYDRNSYLKSLLSKIPFIVKSRASIDLVTNLTKINAPILFEGLHTTFPLIKDTFNDRNVLVRTHNIEHLYYKGLSKSERKIYKKLFFKIEAKKLLDYESILTIANHILTISLSEQIYFKKNFGHKAVYIPVFHQNKAVKKLSKKGDYALYHGDLRISDNVKSVLFLIDLFKKINYPFLIAGSFKNKELLNEINKHKNIQFVEVKNQNHIIELLEKAHINAIPTFQKTGIKLKLINTLFNSRFCVVTKEMVEDTGLEDLCFICNTKQEFIDKVIELITKDYETEETIKRSKVLKTFNTEMNAQKIVDLLY